MKHLAVLLIILSSQYVFAEKVLIITHAYNRPDFIEIQHKTFQKFLADEYEFVVFNDASTDKMAQRIEKMCHKCGVGHVRIPQEIHSLPYLPRPHNDPLKGHTAVRHANALQYSLDTLGFDHAGIVLILDSDMFLVRSVNIHELMYKKDILSAVRGGSSRDGRYEVTFLWPGLCFLHMNTLPDKRTLNFNCGYVENDIIVDSGGWTHYYLKKHPLLRIVELETLWSHKIGLGNYEIESPIDHKTSKRKNKKKYKKMGFNDKEITFLLSKPDTFEFLFDKRFFHYHNGSDHSKRSRDYIQHKDHLFKQYIEDILHD